MKSRGERRRSLTATRLKLRDVPDGLRRDFTLTLKQYTVPLIGLRVADGGEVADFLGSGTLVTFRNAYYILTAAHVWRKLSKFPSVAMSLVDYGSRFVVETSAVVPTLAGTRNYQEWGPDIALLRLPLVAVPRIRAHKVFYNLARHLDNSSQRQPSLRWGLVAVAGVAAERSQLGPRAMRLKGGIFLSIIEKRHRRGTYDYYDVPAREVGTGDVPGSFGGLSGGGLWHIILHLSRSTGKLSWKRNLIGLAFYQSPVRRSNRFIRCHGRRSLYVKALGSLASPNSRV